MNINRKPEIERLIYKILSRTNINLSESSSDTLSKFWEYASLLKACPKLTESFNPHHLCKNTN
jgi:hypothetical protein